MALLILWVALSTTAVILNARSVQRAARAAGRRPARSGHQWSALRGEIVRMLVQLGLLSSAIVRFAQDVEPAPSSLGSGYVYYIGFVLTIITLAGRLWELRDRDWQW